MLNQLDYLLSISMRDSAHNLLIKYKHGVFRTPSYEVFSNEYHISHKKSFKF